MELRTAAKTLRTPALLADDALLAVTGGHGHHHHHHHHEGGSSTSQSNSVGDINVYAPNNSGTITIVVNQSNSTH